MNTRHVGVVSIAASFILAGCSGSSGDSTGSTDQWLGDTPHDTAFVAPRLASALAAAGLTPERIEPFDFLHPALPDRSVAGLRQSQRRPDEFGSGEHVSVGQADADRRAFDLEPTDPVWLRFADGGRATHGQGDCYQNGPQ